MSVALRRSAAIGILLILTANLFGGASYPVQKLALEGLPPATIALLRTLVALVPMLWLVRRRGWDPAAFPRGDRLRILFLGTFAYGLPLLLGIVGVKLASAANASILILLEPVTIVAAAWLLLGERVGLGKVIGIVAGLAGALFIVLEGVSPADLLAGSFAGEHATGNLLLAVHGVLWGLYTPIAKPLCERYGTVELTMLTLVGALPLLLPAAALEWTQWSANEAALRSLLWCLALGLFVSLLGTFFWLAALQRLRASTIAPFVFLQPFVGVLLGVLLLDEVLTPAAMGGGGLIVLGVALSIRREAR
jgi:drug/metabolite transporter (DMT)-like permease